VSETSLGDAKMELDLILIQWSMPDDLRAALKHLKQTIEKASLPNPSIPFNSLPTSEEE
jgi:hypothetical protein